MSSHINVLIVDDFETMRTIIKNGLNDLQITNTVEADNGNNALKVIEQYHKENKKIDVIFCDWNMPEMTGLQLLEHLKKDERFKNIPFVMITAEAEMKNIMIAVKAGVTEYLVKPVNKTELQKKITKIIETIA